MHTLIKKSLVVKQGSGSHITFILSNDGCELARQLVGAEVVAPLHDKQTDHRSTHERANVSKPASFTREVMTSVPMQNGRRKATEANGKDKGNVIGAKSKGV